MSPDDLFRLPIPAPMPAEPVLLPPPPPKSRQSVVPLSVVLWILPIQLLLLGAGFCAWRFWIDPPYRAKLVDPRGDLAADEKSTIELYNKLRPSVVHITTLTDGTD